MGDGTRPGASLEGASADLTAMQLRRVSQWRFDWSWFIIQSGQVSGNARHKSLIHNVRLFQIFPFCPGFDRGGAAQRERAFRDRGRPYASEVSLEGRSADLTGT